MSRKGVIIFTYFIIPSNSRELNSGLFERSQTQRNSTVFLQRSPTYYQLARIIHASPLVIGASFVFSV